MSSKRQRDNKYHFVVDEDLGSSYWKELSLDNRFIADRFEQHWDAGTPDAVWLPHSGNNKLIVITHDRRLRRQHRNKVIHHNCRIIVSVGASDFQGQAAAFRASWHKIERFLGRTPVPFIARFRRPTGKALNKLRPTGDIVLDDFFKN